MRKVAGEVVAVLLCILFGLLHILPKLNFQFALAFKIIPTTLPNKHVLLINYRI